jgi:predicted permease
VVLRATLTREARERALSDLADVHARVSEVWGWSAGRRACGREALSIVMWSLVDRARRVAESRADARSTRRLPMFGDFGQDVRFSARGLMRRPGFSVIAVGVLALGIGANVAIFSLADRLFLRPPPAVRAPEELVRVFRSWSPGMGGSLSYPDYLDYRDGATTLSGLAATASSTLSASARFDGSARPVRAQTVTANYFDVLGLEPAVGRFFRSEENVAPDKHPVAVITWGFWMNGLGGASDVVGRTLLLNGHSFTIVGVAPREFRGLTPSDPALDVYIPILMRNAVAPQSGTAWRERVPNSIERWIAVVGRVRPGVPLEAVQAELDRIAARIQLLDPANESKETVLVTQHFRWYPSQHTSLSNLTRVLLLSVGLLLAIATANVAILLLARASSRDREIGVRAALGAGRGRVARQMMTESLLIGAAGCVLGVVISLGAVRVAGALLPVTLALPTLPGSRVLVFAAALSLVTALIVGMAPSWRAARSDVVGLIQGRDRRAGGGRVRDALVIVQVSLSLLLVAGSVLFARSLAAARSIDVGFDARGVLLAGVNLRNHGYDAARGSAFAHEAMARVSAVPGVALVTVTRQVPFQGDWSTTMKAWPGASFAGGRTEMDVGLNVVGAGYFEGMGIPLRSGREFEGTDVEGSTPVIIVNETFARRAFATLDVVGRTVPLRGDAPPFTIVGVARDATYYELDEDPFPQAYAPFTQRYVSDITFLVKTSVNPSTLAGPVQRAILDVDPNVAFSTVETLESVHAEQIARYRATAHVVGLSGLIALLLASAGLYGAMAYRVAQRTREIGLRMALGATRRTLAWEVMARGLRLVVIGAVLGFGAALALGRLTASLLFEVRPNDPVSLVAAPIVLLVVAAAAVFVPARRAMRIDPMRAMRAE